MLPPRKKKATKRGRFDPTFRSKEHMAWVRSRFSCAVRGCTNVTDRIDPCHITEPGKAAIGRKESDARVIPLCRTHHRELDAQIGVTAFQQKYGLEIEEMIADLGRESPILRDLRRKGEYPPPAP